MSTTPWIFGALSSPSHAVNRAPAVADAVVPGDPWAGVELAQAALGWTPSPERTVFVRAAAMSHGLVHVSVLRFDDRGFGAFRAELLPADGRLTRALAKLVEGADHWVVVRDGSRAADRVLAHGEGAEWEERSAQEISVYEAGVLGLTRDAEVAWSSETLARSAYYDRDALAAHALAESARADLFALVAMSGAGVAVH